MVNCEYTAAHSIEFAFHSFRVTVVFVFFIESHHLPVSLFRLAKRSSSIVSPEMWGDVNAFLSKLRSKCIVRRPDSTCVRS